MEDTDELVALLCTHIGMIMEDAGYVALTIGSLSGFERSKAIAKLHNAARTAERLMEAVRAVSP
jgi:hypothetical protein